MKAVDLFGSNILFRFEGKSQLKTSFGSAFSLIILAIVGIRLAFIIMEVWTRKTPQVIYSERQVSSPEQFNFTYSTSRFAFGLQEPVYSEHFIDPSVYNVTIMKTKKTTVFDSNQNKKVSTHEFEYITPIPCTRDSFNNMETPDFFLGLSYTNLYCFETKDYLTIAGDYTSEVFEYATLSVQRCKGITCADEQTISEKLKNAYFAIYFTDVLVDPENRDDPFKTYSRDLYWIVNEDNPKNVDIFYRNTYIASDFGWVYEDTFLQRFVQFSQANVSYLPEGSVDFFFQLLFRFEKQKENVYKRKYKNINSIISEIGGFTQTLLALGYLICTRLSQLELNKRIINHAFNFEEISSIHDVPPSSDQSPSNNQQQENHQKRQQQQKRNHSQSNFKKNQLNKQLQKLAPDYATSDQAVKFDSQPMIAAPQFTQGVSLLQQQQHQHSPQPQVGSSFKKITINTNNLSYQNQQGSYQNSPILPSGKGNNNNNKIDTKLNSLMLSSIIQQKTVKQQVTPGSVAVNMGKSQQMSQSVQPGEKTVTASVGIANETIPDTHFKKMMNQFRGSMELNVWEYVKFFVWPFGKIKAKKQIIDYSIDKLYYHLDVLNVVKKLLEVEKLKRLIMDDDQLKLFEFLPKPLIKTASIVNNQNSLSTIPASTVNNNNNNVQNNNNNPNDILYQDTRSDLEKARQAYSSYVKISSKPHQQPLEQKLLNLMDKNILQLFQQDLEDEGGEEVEEICEEENERDVEQNCSQIELGVSLHPSCSQKGLSEQNITDQIDQIISAQNGLKSPTVETPNHSIFQYQKNTLESKFKLIDSIKLNNNPKDEESSQDAFEKEMSIQVPTDESFASRNSVKTKRFPINFFK